MESSKEQCSSQPFRITFLDPSCLKRKTRRETCEWYSERKIKAYLRLGIHVALLMFNAQAHCCFPHILQQQASSLPWLKLPFDPCSRWLVFSFLCWKWRVFWYQQASGRGTNPVDGKLDISWASLAWACAYRYCSLRKHLHAACL